MWDVTPVNSLEQPGTSRLTDQQRLLTPSQLDAVGKRHTVDQLCYLLGLWTVDKDSTTEKKYNIVTTGTWLTNNKTKFLIVTNSLSAGLEFDNLLRTCTGMLPVLWNLKIYLVYVRYLYK